MKKFIIHVSIASMLVSLGLAQDVYTVKFGDTLSHIVKAHYPTEQLYGRQGKLREVLKHNPQIKNFHRIYPNQKIHFMPMVEVAPTPSVADVAQGARIIIVPEQSSPKVVEVPKEEKQDRKISEQRGLEEWNISALYGAKFLSVSQTGALGKADIGVFSVNDLKVNSEFLFEDFSLGFQMDSYKFSYKSLSSGDSERMYALNLYGAYKWFLGGLNIEQNPLFRNNGGNIEMEKMTLFHLSLGAKKDIELPTRKPTMIKLKGWVNYPLSTSSSNADVKTSSVSGYGVIGQVELNREIMAKSEYSLHATWLTQAGIQQLKQNVEWDVSKGEAKSSITNASTTLGLLLKF